MSTPALRVLVMAKAPVPGRAKTRLAAAVGDDAAARLATAALLDTLAAATSTVGAAHCALALAGDLGETEHEAEIRQALHGWHVFPQEGGGFADRLAHAHNSLGDGPVIQIGMDTPQVSPADLLSAVLALASHDTALGLASDGGWWAFARTTASAADVLPGVPMSTSTTGADTKRALSDAGWSVAHLDQLDDVDDHDDAERVATLAPHSRFAQAWREVRTNRESGS